MDQEPTQPPNQDGQQGPQQPSVPSQQPIVPPIPQILSQPVLSTPAVMNWSHFKPNFSGKPDADPEAHLLRTIDWMDTFNFAAGH